MLKRLKRAKPTIETIHILSDKQSLNLQFENNESRKRNCLRLFTFGLKERGIESKTIRVYAVF
jgi:hypothetical protein